MIEGIIVVINASSNNAASSSLCVGVKIVAEAGVAGTYGLSSG